MNLQDIIFLLVVLILLYKRNYKYFIYLGLLSLLISVPLFSFWVFFTAQRLTYYAAAFFLFATILFISKKR